MAIRGWLRSFGLERYADAFEANDIDLRVAADLTADDLRELGVASVGHRRRLLSAIAALAAERPETVDAAADSGDPARTPARAGLAERRQVSVLFADLVGYTQLSKAVGNEELHEILSAFFDRVDRIVSAYGGSVNKHIGDCVMAVFGAPVAHDNDPERAALTARAIAESMPDLSDSLGRRIEVHSGIASGQAVATELGSDLHRGFEVIGDAVNRASRLADRAGAGEILVSDAVRRMLPGRIRLERCPDDEHAGSPAAWRLVGVSAEAAPEVRDSPIFGRTSELGLLAGALAECRERGSGRVVLVRGEAGIGKSRLVEAFREQAEAEGVRAHTGLVIDFGGGSRQDAIRTLVRSLLDSGTDGEAAIDAARALGLPRAREPFLNDLLGLPQTDELRHVYEAMDNDTRNAGKRETVAELVRAASRTAPRLIIVEDVHWADRLVLDHLAHLAHSLADAPALLVITTRREGDPLDESWRAEAGGRSMLTVDLGPPLGALAPIAAAKAAAFANGTDGVWQTLRAAEATHKAAEQAFFDAHGTLREQLEKGVPPLDPLQERLIAAERRLAQADQALLAAPVLTIEDAARKLESAMDHLDPEDWSADLVANALAGLRGMTA